MHYPKQAYVEEETKTNKKSNNRIANSILKQFNDSGMEFIEYF